MKIREMCVARVQAEDEEAHRVREVSHAGFRE